MGIDREVLQIATRVMIASLGIVGSLSPHELWAQAHSEKRCAVPVALQQLYPNGGPALCEHDSFVDFTPPRDIPLLCSNAQYKPLAATDSLQGSLTRSCNGRGQQRNRALKLGLGPCEQYLHKLKSVSVFSRAGRFIAAGIRGLGCRDGRYSVDFCAGSGGATQIYQRYGRALVFQIEFKSGARECRQSSEAG